MGLLDVVLTPVSRSGSRLLRLSVWSGPTGDRSRPLANACGQRAPIPSDTVWHAANRYGTPSSPFDRQVVIGRPSPLRPQPKYHCRMADAPDRSRTALPICPGRTVEFDSAYEGTPPWDIGHPQPAFLGPPGMNVGRFHGSGPRSCGRTWLMGPRVTMIRARAAPAEWNPYARLMIRRTRLFRPSCLALLMPSRTAASIPARRLRMVAARVTNGFRPLRWALEQNRSSRNATSVSSRSESNTARSASLRV